MIKGRFYEFLLHPAFMSFLLWIITILFIPLDFTKFRLTLIQEEFTDTRNKYFYFDLDKDQISEKVLVDLNDTLQTKVQVIKNNRVHDQYNLKYQYWDMGSMYAGDGNHDGASELYLFTLSRDSIFLHIIDPVKRRRVIRSDIYVDSWKKATHSINPPQIRPVGLIRGTTGNSLDFFFIITAGYCLYPRNAYLYSVSVDSLIRSSIGAASPIDCTVAEITADSLPELLLNIMAPGNYSKDFPYSDQFAWLMVLDNHMKFLFTPVKMGPYPSQCQVIPLITGDSARLVVFYDYFGTESIGSSLSLYNAYGKNLGMKTITRLEHVYAAVLQNDHTEQGTFYFIKNRKSEVEEMDSSFRVIRTLTIPAVEHVLPLAHFDANMDGEKEYFFQGRGYDNFIITQPDFQHAVTFSYERSTILPYITQVLQQGQKPMIYLQYDDHGALMRFDKDPLYILKYPFYCILYLSIFLLVTMIARIQRYRLELKKETEQKMAAWQMKAIKNQIDPHFTLNILNAIGSLYASDHDRDRADYLFSKYARLIRQTVISSDQIIITLEEELEFVRNYIDLELLRHDHAFGYSIEADDNIDLLIRIPRMLIHTFVENAIKYGIRRNQENGFLKITVRSSGQTCQIAVQDNGPGIAADPAEPTGTGKGLMIVNELTDLYFKLEKKKITWSINNLHGAESQKTGTRVLVVIHL